MAEREVDTAIDEEIARGDMETMRKTREDKYTPSYQVVGDSRVPVSVAHGKLWQSRLEQGRKKRRTDNLDKAWAEALRYYRNDQVAHRDDSDDGVDGDYAGNESGAMKLYRRFSETENIVFANTSALVPTLYAKNPTVEFTAVDQDDNETGVLVQDVVNRLLAKKSQPGINLKPKARKAVVMCTLTNAAYVEVGYTFREQSSQQAIEDITRLSKQLEKAKTPQAVRELEGKIQALEETVSMLRPAGPWAKFRRPQDVIFDPDAVEDDHSDAKWGMIADYINTSYLNAKFRERKSGKTVSLYKPTHIVSSGDAGKNTAEHEIDNYSLFNDDEGKKDNAAAYGYADEDAFRGAQRTKCWWVWDKTTQRVLLYADNDWTWPIWVWDDPYHLQGFYPLSKLQFYTDPEEAMSKGEVTYYLDQQDALNQINSEMKQARQWARRNLFYDKNKVSKDEVEKFMKGDEDVAVGVDVPEGMNLKDMVQSITPPSMQFVQLFDKQPILEAIDRVSSVQPVMRGVEFKTNTTNQAINQYNSIQQTRTDEKIDAVEDFIGQIGWAVAQLCLQFMTAEEVAVLIGERKAAMWQQMDAPTIATQLQMTVVGGSTQKQTSESKKQQALQMGQVLGQFVNASPQPVLAVLVKTLRGAFNDVIPDEEWQIIMDAIMGQGGGAPAPSAAGGGNGAEGGGAPTSPESQPDPIVVLEQLTDALPPEALQALGMAMARGVPVREAIERIIPAVQQQTAQPQQA